MNVENLIARRLRGELAKAGAAIKRYVEAGRNAWRRRVGMKDRYGEVRPLSWHAPTTR
ncbi:MAG TPA: hypothetical protein VKU41_07285 [Polyangiaceae bacterium]|nr:hypothetical protein [Polyangiaceae bacterium]